MILQSNRVLVKILAEHKESTYVKKIIATDGREFKLFTDTPAEKGSINYYAQSVLVGHVMQIGCDIDNIQVNDLVMLDYTADADEANVMFENPDFKVLCLLGKNEYEQEDEFIPASLVTSTDTYVCRKGDVAELSPILGVIRDGDALPNTMMVIAEFHDDEKDIKRIPGVDYDQERLKFVQRKVIRACPGSDLQKGDMVLLPSEFVSSYQFLDYKYSLFFEHDVIMKC